MTNDDKSLFGDLRSALALAPSEEVFANVCDLLGDGRTSDTILEYLLQTFSRWPATMERSIPAAWLARGFDDPRALPPASRICNRLLLHDVTLDQDAFVSLLTSPDLSNLAHLAMGRCGLDRRRLAALLDAPSCPRLLSLTIWSEGFDTKQARVIAHSEVMCELRSLHLSGPISDSGARLIAESPYIKDLEYLGFHGASLTGEGAEAIASSEGMKRLTEINLQNNAIGARGVRALARSPHITALKDIDLSYNDLDTDAITAIAEATAWRSLGVLGLEAVKLRDEHLHLLAKTANLPSLHGLCASSNELGSSCLEGFDHAIGFEKLTHLELCCNGIDDRGAEILAGAPRAANLRLLDLDLTDISAAGKAMLDASPYLIPGPDRILCW